MLLKKPLAEGAAFRQPSGKPERERKLRSVPCAEQVGWNCLKPAQNGAAQQ
jgi:hypothetical protein